MVFKNEWYYLLFFYFLSVGKVFKKKNEVLLILNFSSLKMNKNK